MTSAARRWVLASVMQQRVAGGNGLPFRPGFENAGGEGSGGKGVLPEQQCLGTDDVVLHGQSGKTLFAVGFLAVEADRAAQHAPGTAVGLAGVDALPAPEVGSPLFRAQRLWDGAA
jgi:hypothetical protein